MGRIKRILSGFISEWRTQKRNNKVLYSCVFENERREANIIRLVHSIEKGLCIDNPRIGFGYDKIMVLFSLVKEHIIDSGNCADSVLMAQDAIRTYCDFHHKIGYSSEKFTEIEKKYEEIWGDNCDTVIKYGGVKNFSKSECDYNLNDIEKLFNTRHSIRNFSEEKVKEELIEKAIRMAQQAPSACNRQAIRVYSIDSKKYMSDINTSLEGIGGFADNADSFLLICGKLSAYSEFEKNQFIVSGSIFAGYLTLALHAMKIANCLVQRSTCPSKQWRLFCAKNSIPEDEQIICMIAIGGMKDNVIVPVSHRYSVDKIFRRLS